MSPLYIYENELDTPFRFNYGPAPSRKCQVESAADPDPAPPDDNWERVYVTGSKNDSAPLLYEHIDKYRGITLRYPNGRNGQIPQLVGAFKDAAFNKAAFLQKFLPWPICGCYNVKPFHQGLGQQQENLHFRFPPRCAEIQRNLLNHPEPFCKVSVQMGEQSAFQGATPLTVELDCDICWGVDAAGFGRADKGMTRSAGKDSTFPWPPGRPCTGKGVWE
jgi:hypothetical protein